MTTIQDRIIKDFDKKFPELSVIEDPAFDSRKTKELSMIHKQPSVLLNKKSDTQTKELEWEKDIFEILEQICGLYKTKGGNWRWSDNGYNYDFNPTMKKLVNLLTQQRSELLEEILNLECLKEEEFDESDDVIDEEVREKRNQLRKEIKEEINKL